MLFFAWACVSINRIHRYRPSASAVKGGRATVERCLSDLETSTKIGLLTKSHVASKQFGLLKVWIEKRDSQTQASQDSSEGPQYQFKVIMEVYMEIV